MMQKRLNLDEIRGKVGKCLTCPLIFLVLQIMGQMRNLPSLLIVSSLFALFWIIFVLSKFDFNLSFFVPTRKTISNGSIVYQQKIISSLSGN